MKRLAILGSTGSIGQSALAVVDAHADRLEVVALAAGENASLLAEQVARYRPRVAAVATDAKAISRTARRPSATGSVPRFGEISQIFRIGFRTRGHASNKLSIVRRRIGQGLCLRRQPLMSGPSVNYRHWGGSEHKHG